MFKAKKSRTVFGRVETLISEDTHVDGVIETSGTIRIDGTVKGGVKKADGVIIGKTGIVEGNIHAQGVNLAGKVRGNIFSEVVLELMPGSTLIGDIDTAQLSISEGAHFDGSCTMHENREKTSQPEQSASPAGVYPEAPEEPT